MKVLIVMPAYNAERTLPKVLRGIPGEFSDLLLVDDKSSDKTIEVARRAGVPVIVHETNRGYGGNQKTCYTEALKRNADIVVMLHPDWQYDPVFIPELIAPIVSGSADAVFGSRMKIRENALDGGMPMWKFRANIFLSSIANFFTGQNFTEWHSGYRAYSRKCLESVDFLSNPEGYDFDVEMTLKLLRKNIRIIEIPITTRYNDDASSIGFFDSLKYGLNFLGHIIKYKLGRS